MTEDYVSFETAKLLKEKGFDEECCPWYGSDGNIHETGCKMKNSDCALDSMMAPTLQMAMKWLREKYNQHINIQALHNVALHRIQYYVEIQNLNEPIEKGILQEFCGHGCHSARTYEEACEYAIKYCLEKLI